MAEGYQPSSALTIALDDAPGGSPVTLTQAILTMGELVITSALEAAHAFGDSAEESLASNMKKLDPITLEAFLHTGAGQSYATFKTPDTDPNGGTRTLTIVAGDSKTLAVGCLLNVCRVKAEVGKLTRISATVTPTGTFAWT